MGMNLIVEDEQGNRHPTWDWMRHAVDKEIAPLLTDTKVRGDKYDCEFLCRYPEGVCHDSDRGRELKLILDDPQWWVFKSY